MSTNVNISASSKRLQIAVGAKWVFQNRPIALLSPLKDIGDDMVAKRARRIADKLRMKAKCRRLYPHDKKARAAEYLAVCSCAMCGNPRRYFGEKTIQERRFAAFAAE